MRVGFDIGGTFTDVILLEETGEARVRKIPSVMEGLGQAIAACVTDESPAGSVTGFVHGTTIASNAVIEGTVAKTGLLTTRGFRDELEMRGQRRPNVYDMTWDRLPPLVSRELRLEVDERILATGAVEKPIDLESTRAALARLRQAGVEALAVAFINSYLNPEHERQAGVLARECLPDIPLCLSSDVLPELKEYERTSTTVINASLVPLVARYLGDLERALAPFRGQLLIMQSNGGLMATSLARERPASMIESGPAAGVLAAARLAEERGWERVLSFDMGGTTAKACLIDGGRPLEKAGGEVGAAATGATRLFGGGGHVLRIPWLDIVEVGAGGGSIAWLDRGGALRVGPQSAGASPGPACYRRGGERPTVTDANLALGYMNPDAIAGNRLRLDLAAARQTIASEIAGPLGLEIEEAAFGILRVANATMMRALRAVSTERGRDPRRFTLIPFGGAGPMHAAALADSLGITEVQIPPLPGLFSALGLLLADYRRDFVRSVAAALRSLATEQIQRALDELEERACRGLEAQGIGERAVRFEYRIDLKYGYQVSELTLSLESREDASVESLEARFHEAHRAAFGFRRDDPVELVNVRLRASAAASSLRFSDVADGEDGNGAAEPVTRLAYFGPGVGTVEASVMTRPYLARSGQPAAGPGIVEAPDTTVVVPPGWEVSAGSDRTLALRKRPAP